MRHGSSSSSEYWLSSDWQAPHTRNRLPERYGMKAERSCLA